MVVEATVGRVDDYFSIVAKGEINTFKDVLDYWTPIRVRAQNEGVSRFLIDYRTVDFRMDYFGMIQLSKYAEDMQFHFNKFKIAVLVLPKDIQILRDYETPAVNRGLRYHTFVDIEEAIAWLSG